MSTTRSEPRTAVRNVLSLRAFLPRRPGEVGIELGEGWLHFAKRPGRRSTAWKTASVEHQAGAGIEAALRESDARAGSATLSLSLSAVDVFPLTIPPDQRSDLDAAVVSHADRRLGYPIADAALDYVALPARFCRQPEGSVSVLVYAVERSLIDGALDALEGAGVEVDHVITPAFALVPLVATRASCRRLIISTSRTSVSIAVAEQGHVLIERLLGWGERNIVSAVGTALGLDAAESRRLLDTAGGDGADSATRGVVRDILAPTFHELVREASSCLDYCASFLHHGDLDAVVLSGPVVSLPGFAAAVEKGLGARTMTLAEAASPLVIPDLPAAYAVAMGAALSIKGLS